jgi:hypothetical protein
VNPKVVETSHLVLPGRKCAERVVLVIDASDLDAVHVVVDVNSRISAFVFGLYRGQRLDSPV